MPELHLDFGVPDVLPKTLPVLALRRGVLLPGGVISLTVGRKPSLSALDATADGLLIIAPQREPVSDPSPSDLLPCATLARVLRTKTPSSGPRQILVQGLARVRFSGFPSTRPHLEATFQSRRTPWPDTIEAGAMADALRAAVKDTADKLGAQGPAKALLNADVPTELFVDGVASLMQEDEGWKKSLLQTEDPVRRAEIVLESLTRLREIVEARRSIEERVQNATQEQQREFLLRKQLDAIRQELGEGGDDDDLARLKARLDEAELPEEVDKVVRRELRRLERISNQSPERGVATDWLEWIADFPWRVRSAVDLDLDPLEEALDNSHFGLEEVKKQVVEHLAVRKLAGEGRADVLLLVGPPGVGKTSIAQAIASATGRKLVRVALGGLSDEAELRGHRRTYIGARPGRLVDGIRKAGTADSVILLDEVDKLSRSARGNPSAALLEILDPEQNHHFVDHYMEVPIDLSKALFIATANDLGSIPPALRDRMEVLDIAGYSPDEKLIIAKRHLLPKLARNAGLPVGAVQFTDDAIKHAIAGWTREAGVRQLQRVLGKVYRRAAVRSARGTLGDGMQVKASDLSEWLGRAKVREQRHLPAQQPGIATGLAWTAAGGDVLYIEASTLPGSGHLHLTGQLGDVMKESARAALTYVLAHGESLGIPLDAMQGNDVHIHVPAGGIPKDGPSAGVTMFTALASMLSGRLVAPDVAMTGEASLRGRVLPVGGIKSKVLAAHRRGLRRIVLPKQNGPDLEDVPAEVRDDMQFILVEHMREVLEAALLPLAAEVERDTQAVAV